MTNQRQEAEPEDTLDLGEKVKLAVVIAALVLLLLFFVLNFDKVVSARRRPAAQIGTAGHAGHAFESVFAVAMNVAAQHRLDVVVLEQVEHDKPVRDAIINRVMRDEYDGLVLVRHFLQRFLQPAHVLR